MRSVEAAALPADGLEAAWLAGIVAISDHQLPTGEIGSYSPGADGRLAYRRSLGATIAVHEALSCFDPSSTWEENRAVRAMLPPSASATSATRRRLGLGAVRIRQRIREHLARQEGADHLFREGGKHSGGPADPGLSAEAALALLDDPARAPSRWSLYARALDRFRGADGLYRAAAAGVDLTVNARVAEYLAVAGEDMEALAAYLLREAGEAAAGQGERIPLEPACALARCWARAQLPGRCQLAAALAPGLVERLQSAGPAGPADLARLLLALLDLGSTSPEIAPAARRLLAELPLVAGWTSDGSAAGAARCPALTWALALAATTRSQTLAEEDCPCASLAS